MWIKHKDTKASLVVSDEWEPKHLNERHINEFKRMGEGGGIMYETKGYDPFLAFKGDTFSIPLILFIQFYTKNQKNLSLRRKLRERPLKRECLFINSKFLTKTPINYLTRLMILH